MATRGCTEIHRHLTRELELLELRGRIQSQVQGQLSQSQREFYLREQLKAIQKELGEGDDAQRAISRNCAQKLEAAGMPEEVKTEAMRELNRLARMPPASPEYGVARTYLEWMANLPWSVSSGSTGGREARGRDSGRRPLRPGKGEGPHPRLPGGAATEAGAEGADPVLRRASRRRQDLAGPLDRARAGPQVRAHLAWAACTTRRRSAATAARTSARCRDRSFRRCAARARTTRCSCWTRSTSSGAISAATRRRALLEVLDPEQNSTFRDNYLDVPFDLSKVLFITTANVLDPVPDALRDRMEIIALEGYTEQEKVIIAFRYLIPRQTTENGLIAEQDIEFSDDAVRFLVRRYTREAGVRNLEREIGTICRKQARRIAEGTREKVMVTPELVEKDLGAPRFRTDTEVAERTRRPGVAVGLAWTPVGGDVLFIEAGRMPGGNKGLIMTGQLGPVMQESVQAALTWVRGNATQVRHRSRPVQDQRHPHPRAGGRDPEGRPVGGHHDGDGAALDADRPAGCARIWR